MDSVWKCNRKTITEMKPNTSTVTINKNGQKSKAVSDSSKTKILNCFIKLKTQRQGKAYFDF